jgi:hypothetical protein
VGTEYRQPCEDHDVTREPDCFFPFDHRGPIGRKPGTNGRNVLTVKQHLCHDGIPNGKARLLVAGTTHGPQAVRSARLREPDVYDQPTASPPRRRGGAGRGKRSRCRIRDRRRPGTFTSASARHHRLRAAARAVRTPPQPPASPQTSPGQVQQAQTPSSQTAVSRFKKALATATPPRAQASERSKKRLLNLRLLTPSCESPHGLSSLLEHQPEQADCCERQRQPCHPLHGAARGNSCLIKTRLRHCCLAGGRRGASHTSFGRWDVS